jgi:very-short-patch-repair endonuclease
VTTHLGVYRVDLAWPKERVLAEFDGQVKYADGELGRGYDGRRALVAEKRREDAIAEALGVRPVRFMAADARDPGAVARRLLARFPAETRNAAIRDRRLPLPPWP